MTKQKKTAVPSNCSTGKDDGTGAQSHTTDAKTAMFEEMEHAIGLLLTPTSGLSAGLVGRATKKKASAIVAIMRGQIAVHGFILAKAYDHG